MKVKLKLSAKERRAGVDLRDVLGHKRARPKPDKPKDTDSDFRAITDIDTSLHDPVRERWEADSAQGGVRFYCTQSSAMFDRPVGEDARWALQVRAQVKLKSGRAGKDFAVGTASMTRADLQWLRDQINDALRRK